MDDNGMVLFQVTTHRGSQALLFPPVLKWAVNNMALLFHVQATTQRSSQTLFALVLKQAMNNMVLLFQSQHREAARPCCFLLC